MFLIFGIKRLRRRMATSFALCGQCGTPAAQVIVRIGTWFSLFFVPLIPLGNKYISTCTLCGKSTKLDKAQALALVSAEQAPPDRETGQSLAPPETSEQPPAGSAPPL